MSQFKIGDWVVSSKSSEIFQIADMFPDGYNEYVTSIKLEPRTKWDSGIYYGQYNIEDVYLWTPSIGDWCWKDTEFVKITHIANHNREDGLLTYSCSVPCRAEFFSSSFIPEPFIGTLPTGAR